MRGNLRWRRPPKLGIGEAVRGVPRLTVAVKSVWRAGGVLEDRVVADVVAEIKARRERSLMAGSRVELWDGNFLLHG